MKNTLAMTIPKEVGLKIPGDTLSARVTPSGNKVVKVSTNGGANKYAAVQYKNGTVVQTKSTKVN